MRSSRRASFFWWKGRRRSVKPRARVSKPYFPLLYLLPLHPFYFPPRVFAPLRSLYNEKSCRCRYRSDYVLKISKERRGSSKELVRKFGHESHSRVIVKRESIRDTRWTRDRRVESRVTNEIFQDFLDFSTSGKEQLASGAHSLNLQIRSSTTLLLSLALSRLFHANRVSSHPSRLSNSSIVALTQIHMHNRKIKSSPKISVLSPRIESD